MVHAVTAGNLFFSNILKVSIGRDLGALKGLLMPSQLETFYFANLLEFSIVRDLEALKGLSGASSFRKNV